MIRTFTALSLLAGLSVLGVAIAHRKTTQTRVGETQKRSSHVKTSGTPILVELFTSEGCSSCPPADNLLARLSKEQPIPGVEIIGLSEHVDYWNRLGWSDPFSAGTYSARQSNYASAFRLDSVYTPQMVVDGQQEFLGSDAQRARSAIQKAAGRPKATITITKVVPKADDAAKPGALALRVRVKYLPKGEGEEVADVMLAITEDELLSHVQRGENAGRHLMHTAVVRLGILLGTVKASGSFDTITTQTLSSAWKRQYLHAVVFVQNRTDHRIVGAATIPLDID
jgi:hypothetical protein